MQAGGLHHTAVVGEGAATRAGGLVRIWRWRGVQGKWGGGCLVWVLHGTFVRQRR